MTQCIYVKVNIWTLKVYFNYHAKA